MDPIQRELRRATAKAFMESLDQLKDSLSDPVEPDPILEETPTPISEADPSETSQTQWLQALEEAAADIEQFIQTQTYD
jgi:hypothetical protein